MRHAHRKRGRRRLRRDRVVGDHRRHLCRPRRQHPHFAQPSAEVRQRPHRSSVNAMERRSYRIFEGFVASVAMCVALTGCEECDYIHATVRGLNGLPTTTRGLRVLRSGGRGRLLRWRPSVINAAYPQCLPIAFARAVGPISGMAPHPMAPGMSRQPHPRSTLEIPLRLHPRCSRRVVGLLPGPRCCASHLESCSACCYWSTSFPACSIRTHRLCSAPRTAAVRLSTWLAPERSWTRQSRSPRTATLGILSNSPRPLKSP